MVVSRAGIVSFYTKTQKLDYFS